jgi:biotin carboxyl carrier protein
LRFIISCDGHKYDGFAVRVKDEVFLQVSGRTLRLTDVSKEDEDKSFSSVGTGERNLVAPMPGSVTKLLVNVGDRVKTGQPLVIVEAMKMENEVRAAIDGLVKKIHVRAGQQVGFGEVLAELEPMEDVIGGK